jgi:hypothetical protein
MRRYSDVLQSDRRRNPTDQVGNRIAPILIIVKKTYQIKHSVRDDQIIRQKLQISILLILEMVLHVIWNGVSVDAK